MFGDLRRSRAVRVCCVSRIHGPAAWMPGMLSAVSVVAALAPEPKTCIALRSLDSYHYLLGLVQF